MSADKYPSIFSRQMATIVYLSYVMGISGASKIDRSKKLEKKEFLSHIYTACLSTGCSTKTTDLR